MQAKSDAQLLREYAQGGEEAAFAELVRRHTNLVFSAAFRQSDSASAAAEIAQKRISRALDKLREQLTRRGVTTTAAALSVAITGNAVHAAPAGLTLTISTAAAMMGTGASAITTATITKTITMTTLQKALITTAAIAAVGGGVYEAHQASTWEGRARTLEAQQTASANQLEELQNQRDEALNAHSALQQENQRLAQAAAEAPGLRRDLGPPTPGTMDANDPAVQHAMEAKAKADKIAQYLQQMPDKNIPELQFLDDNDWLTAAKSAKFDTEADVRRTLSELRRIAKNNLPMGRSLYAFINDNNGQLPTAIAQLKPYFAKAVTDSAYYHWRGIQSAQDDVLVDSILGRYALLHSGSVNDYPPGTWFIAEKAAVDKDCDTRLKAAPGTSAIHSTGFGETGDADDNSY